MPTHTAKIVVALPLADVAENFEAFLADATDAEIEQSVERVTPRSFDVTRVEEGIIDELGALFPEYLDEWSSSVTRYELAARASGTEIAMTTTYPETLDVALRILGATIGEPDLANPFPRELLRELRVQLTDFVRAQVAAKQQPQRPGMDIQ